MTAGSRSRRCRSTWRCSITTTTAWPRSRFGTPFIDTDGRTIIPVINENLTTGHTYGAELLVEWQPVDDWRLSASYSHIDMDLTPHGQDLNRGEWQEDSTPRDIAGLRSLITSWNALRDRRAVALPVANPRGSPTG